MEVGDQDYIYILDTLKKGREKIQDLKNENGKLREANQKLVQLVEKLETVIEEETDGFEWEESEYDYPGQWTPSDIVHEKDIELGEDFNVEDIDSQISEAIKSMKRAQKFKNE